MQLLLSTKSQKLWCFKILVRYEIPEIDIHILLLDVWKLTFKLKISEMLEGILSNSEVVVERYKVLSGFKYLAVNSKHCRFTLPGV